MMDLFLGYTYFTRGIAQDNKYKNRIMKLGLIIFLVLGLGLSSMVVPVSPKVGLEMKVDSIVKPDSVKYIVFTSSDHSDSDVHRLWNEKWQRYAYYLSDTSHYNVTFSPVNGAQAIVKPKSFLKTVQYADWNLLSRRMNKEESAKMYHFFIHECHEWKRKSGKETKLYFIDRRDYSGDSIKMYRVYCRSARSRVNEIIDELVY